MATQSAPKPRPPQHVHATAFGVSFSVDEKRKAVESGPMSRQKKAVIWFSVLIAASALVLWWQFRNPLDLDTDAQNNPGIRKVVELEQKRDTSGLAQLMKSDDAAVASRAVTALAGISGADSIRESLSDTRADVRYAAVSAMGSNPDVSQLPLLDQYTQDPASDVRIAAVRSISNIRDFSIFEHLMPMLNDPSPSVRRAALGAVEDRIGLKFPEFNPEDPPERRARGVARIRSMVPHMKQVFDQANEFELRNKKK